MMEIALAMGLVLALIAGLLGCYAAEGSSWIIRAANLPDGMNMVLII
jgi:hypothetical protein